MTYVMIYGVGTHTIYANRSLTPRIEQSMKNILISWSVRRRSCRYTRYLLNPKVTYLSLGIHNAGSKKYEVSKTYRWLLCESQNRR